MRLPDDVIDRINRHLIATGRTQREFAAAVGTWQPTISRVLSGERGGFSEDVVARIVAELDRAEQEDDG